MPAAVVAIPASVVLVGVGATAVALVALVAGAIVVRRRRHQAAAAERARAIPELVELFQLAASAGHPVPAALEAVGARAPPPVHAPLDLAVGSLRRGMAVDEVLVALATELGDPGLALVDALRRSAATGASLPVLLTDVAATARDRRLRDAQAAARRLPVTLLLPLAACTLPAAILLAVVPVIAVSLEALHL